MFKTFISKIKHQKIKSCFRNSINNFYKNKTTKQSTMVVTNNTRRQYSQNYVRNNCLKLYGILPDFIKPNLMNYPKRELTEELVVALLSKENYWKEINHIPKEFHTSNVYIAVLKKMFRPSGYGRYYMDKVFNTMCKKRFTDDVWMQFLELYKFLHKNDKCFALDNFIKSNEYKDVPSYVFVELSYYCLWKYIKHISYEDVNYNMFITHLKQDYSEFTPINDNCLLGMRKESKCPYSQWIRDNLDKKLLIALMETEPTLANFLDDQEGIVPLWLSVIEERPDLVEHKFLKKIDPNLITKQMCITAYYKITEKRFPNVFVELPSTEFNIDYINLSAKQKEIQNLINTIPERLWNEVQYKITQ